MKPPRLEPATKRAGYWDIPPREPSIWPGYIKHVVKEGARYHVVSWSEQGTHCSERDCEINRRAGNMDRPDLADRRPA